MVATRSNERWPGTARSIAARRKRGFVPGRNWLGARSSCGTSDAEYPKPLGRWAQFSRSRDVTDRTDRTSFTEAQIAAFRMHRHHLDLRAPSSHLPNVVRDVCGVQAQVTAMARIALWARLRDLAVDDVERALEKKRTIVKTWSMRGGAPPPGLERTPPVSPRSHADEAAARAEVDPASGLEGGRGHRYDPRRPQERPADPGPARGLFGEEARDEDERLDGRRVGTQDGGVQHRVAARPTGRDTGPRVLRSEPGTANHVHARGLFATAAA